MPQEDLDQLKTALIADSFRHHYEKNAFYRRACIEKNVHPDQITHLADLTRIPLVPIAKFKSAASHELLSKPLSAIEHEMRSTARAASRASRVAVPTRSTPRSSPRTPRSANSSAFPMAPGCTSARRPKRFPRWE